MKELKIGRILVEHRRRRNITQEELAEYIGVSKASVSKWETATTYPDITLLPQLATFFNISIAVKLLKNISHARPCYFRSAAYM